MKVDQVMKPSSPNYKYQSLDQGNTANVLTTTHISPPRLPSRILLLSLLTAVVVLGALLATVLPLHLQHLLSTKPRPELSCGNSVAEAKQSGCSFDVLAKAWLPAACPRYGLNEFEAAATTGPQNQSRWRYWRDPSGQQELSIEDLASLNRSEKWWGTEREHLTHCAWLLVRKAYALAEDGRVDKLTADFDHSKHCTMLLLWRALQAEGIDAMDTSGNVVVGGC